MTSLKTFKLNDSTVEKYLLFWDAISQCHSKYIPIETESNQSYIVQVCPQYSLVYIKDERDYYIFLLLNARIAAEIGNNSKIIQYIKEDFAMHYGYT